MTETPNWDLLVLGKSLLTMEPDTGPIPNGAVAISGGRIVAVGEASDLLEMAPTCEVLNASNCLVMPGLVNTHSHLAMSLLRGLADDLPLKTWLEGHIWPAESHHVNRESVAVGSRLAAAEQLLAGVTTTTDMYFFADAVCEALVEAGIRGVVAESLIDASTPRCSGPEEMLARQRQLCEEWKDHPLITPSVAAHAPYTVGPTNLVKEAELADELAVPLQIHLAETRWEVETLLEKRGATPVAYLEDIGFLSDRVVAAHCVHVSREDIETLAENNVGVSHNPVSNLKLSSGVAPVPKMLEAGIKLGLGTDGAASNNGLDLLRDLQIAALLHKGTSGDPTTLPAQSILEMATIDGARVLGLSESTGMITVGRNADLACFALDTAHATPMYDPYSHMVFAARAADARHVVVQGKVVVRDRELQTMDLKEIRAKVNEIAKGIRG
ncbi:MAG: amidohydrolase [Thermoanaerobaculales bacterium]|nr:amidohydrolase [Thermoanaerobaculales bacterium]